MLDLFLKVLNARIINYTTIILTIFNGYSPYGNLWLFIEGVNWILPMLLLPLLLLSIAIYLRSRKKQPCPERSTSSTYKPDKFAEEELQFLRTQMNPHFLFNSFNAIKALIQQTKNEEALHYLVDFSKLMRSIVNNSEKRTIQLKEELELTELFISLENLRYKNQFNFSIEVAKEVNLNAFQVPPMLLRSYLEKAIWRNRLSESETNQLSIKVVQNQGNLCFIIEDDGLNSDQVQQMIEKRRTGTFFIERGIYEGGRANSIKVSSENGTILISERHDSSSPSGKNRLIITLTKLDQKQIDGSKI